MTVPTEKSEIFVGPYQVQPNGFWLASNWIADCKIVSVWFEIFL